MVRYTERNSQCNGPCHVTMMIQTVKRTHQSKKELEGRERVCVCE
jgi:hypothetical protein